MLDPDPRSLSLTLIFLALALLAYGGTLSAFQAALAALSPSQIRKEAEAGGLQAQKLRKALDRAMGFPPERPLGFAKQGCGILGGALWCLGFFSPVASALSGGPNAPVLRALALVGMALIYRILFGFFGDRLPHKVALRDPDRLAHRRAGAALLLVRLSYPAYSLREALVNGALRLAGVDVWNLTERVTEEELLQMVDEAEERDAIEENEKDMIANILDFNDTTAEETMTHRTDIVAVEDTAPISQAVALAVERGTSRVPVYHEDIDSVVGICYVKDLLPYVGRPLPEEIGLTDLMRPAYFVPESKKCSQLFTEMTERKVQIAIVVDEYGGTAGLVTLEDLVESIVGNIQDEYDKEEEGEPRRLSERAYTVDGAITIDEASALTGVQLPEGDYDTLAGLVTQRLGRIPKEGEHPKVEVAGLTITVLKVEDQRLARLLLVRENSQEGAKEHGES